MTRNALLLVLLAAAACDAGSAGRREASGRGAGVPRDAVDSVLATPPVVSEPTVVVFWLWASDTLHPDDAAAAYDELTLATESVAGALAAFEIEIVPTHADTVFVELPNRRRQAIVLSGLEFPFGYLLIEPGSTERVLSGVYGEAELLDEIRAYFDLPADSTATPARVTT
ncbi:MAG: hypothetical protein ACREMJ_00225 [Gemmatimonadales bacterium]